MTADYRIFFVQQATLAPGQGQRAMDWFDEMRGWMLEDAHVKDVRVYAPQFGLGQRELEVWTEIDSYAAMDDWDHMSEDRIASFLKIGETYRDVITIGETRIMGDWPASSVYA